MYQKILLLFLFIILNSCKKPDVNKPDSVESRNKSLINNRRIVMFAPHPLHNPARLEEMYGPIIDILNKKIPEVFFKLESSTNYSDFNSKIKTMRIDLILPNPYQTIIAQKYNYHVFAKMGDDESFRGLVLVPKNSSIKTIKDLKGKTIAFPAPSALAGAMMPKYYMQTHGVDVKHNEIKMVYPGSQETSILAVFQGRTDAAATWTMAWNSFSAEKKELNEKLKVLFVTDKLINNSLMVKNDFDAKLLAKIKNIFLTLHENNEGKAILSKMKLSKFENSSNNDYKVAVEFLEQYVNVVGELAE